jgi:hypothetical protein
MKASNGIDAMATSETRASPPPVLYCVACPTAGLNVANAKNSVVPGNELRFLSLSARSLFIIPTKL